MWNSASSRMGGAGRGCRLRLSRIAHRKPWPPLRTWAEAHGTRLVLKAGRRLSCHLFSPQMPCHLDVTHHDLLISHPRATRLQVPSRLRDGRWEFLSVRLRASCRAPQVGLPYHKHRGWSRARLPKRRRTPQTCRVLHMRLGSRRSSRLDRAWAVRGRPARRFRRAGLTALRRASPPSQTGAARDGPRATTPSPPCRRCSRTKVAV